MPRKASSCASPPATEISCSTRNFKCCDEHSFIFCHVDTVCWASAHCMGTFRLLDLWGHGM